MQRHNEELIIKIDLVTKTISRPELINPDLISITINKNMNVKRLESLIEQLKKLMGIYARILNSAHYYNSEDRRHLALEECREEIDNLIEEFNHLDYLH